MIITIVLTVFAILGVVIQFIFDDTREDKKKKRIGIYALVLSVLLLIANNFKQLADSNKLSKEKNTLIQKLDSCNSSINRVGENQSALKGKYDSLYNQYLNTELLLSEAKREIQTLLLSTREGFDRNEEAIKKIDKIQVKNQREISKSKRAEIVKSLKQYRGSKIEFFTVNTSPEAIQFSKELQSIFIESGWVIGKDIRMLVPDSENKGLILIANKDKEVPYTYLVYKILKDLGYGIKVYNDSTFEKDQLRIIVGFNE